MAARRPSPRAFLICSSLSGSADDCATYEHAIATARFLRFYSGALLRDRRRVSPPGGAVLCHPGRYALGMENDGKATRGCDGCPLPLGRSVDSGVGIEAALSRKRAGRRDDPRAAALGAADEPHNARRDCGGTLLFRTCAAQTARANGNVGRLCRKSARIAGVARLHRAAQHSQPLMVCDQAAHVGSVAGVVSDRRFNITAHLNPTAEVCLKRTIGSPGPARSRRAARAACATPRNRAFAERSPSWPRASTALPPESPAAR